MIFCVIWGYLTFQVPGFMLEYNVGRLGINLHIRLLRLLFPNVFVVKVTIISAIALKIKIRILIVLQQFREDCLMSIVPKF